MKLCSISVVICMSEGGMFWSIVSSLMGSDVEETHVVGVLLDEQLSRGDVVAHQGLEHVLGPERILHGDLEQGPGLGVHGGLPELGGVHLSETLEPGGLDLGMVLL